MKTVWLLVAALAATLILLVAGVLGLRAWYASSLEPVPRSASDIVVLRIDSGASSAEIASQLKQEGLIRSRLAFRWYLYREGYSGRVQAGLYRLPTNLSVPELATRLVNGDTDVHSLTITSGLRLDQIMTLLEKAGFNRADIERALTASYPYTILSNKPAEVSLEGYLFPDTYRLEVDRPPEDLIDLILSNTEIKITDQIRQGWVQQGLNLHQGLTLASIVQKEVSKPDDQRQVAQVFLKRLRIGMPLEADPTFEYAAVLLGVPASTAIDSPYNTYKYAGLPPTPIATVELSAVQAVANPATTDWLYFLSDKEGVTHFTDNEEKHKQNIEQYLR
ncbi:endolytic transglycosylase MltG [Candidatus Microgenomates bacterium]|nr:endolytic transglycosylase MltG [Candidatus Microgenomates bacterium]